MFTVGHNMPGYLPEADVDAFDDFADAVEGLVETVQRYYDDEPMSLDFANLLSVVIDDARDAPRPMALGYTLTGPDGRDTHFFLGVE